MTEMGYAEFFLASLLGYLHGERRQPQRGPDILRVEGGQYLHCVGHSFGGRFLGEAIAAAATPSAPTLALGQLTTVTLRPVDQEYGPAELSHPIVNVNASSVYRGGRLLPGGAHSDFWYEESIHTAHACQPGALRRTRGGTRFTGGRFPA